MSLTKNFGVLVFRNFRARRYTPLILLALFIALECIPFWAFQYFPSQDGPSHLYNASILANYKKQVVYQDYYAVAFPLDGNIATQAVVVGMLKLGVPPHLAQKLLLTAYAVLFPLCLWYLLASIDSQATVFSLFAILFIPNFFLHKGFWNFCIGVPLALLALGYYIRHKERWSYLSIILFVALGGILYSTHIVAWGIFAMAVIVYEIADQILALSKNKTRVFPALVVNLSKRQVLALCALIPPGLLTVTYSLMTQARRHAATAAPESLLHKLRILCSLSFLHTLSRSDIVTARVVALLVALMFIAALSYRFQRRYLMATDAILAAGAVCAILAIFGPDRVGDGSYIHLRVSFFALIFLIVWLAAQQWNKWTTVVIWAVVSLIAIVSLAVRLPEYRRWDNVLNSFAKVGQWIRPGAAVLSVKTVADQEIIDPLIHAVDWLTPRPFIDLCNYEAGTDQFPLHFRQSRSPDGILARSSDPEQVSSIFNISRYETQTQGCVDYILVYASPKFIESSGGAVDHYQAGLGAYRLAFASDIPLKIQLYTRRKICR